jgi:insulysin
MAGIELITDRLEKPELDDRSYRVIRLANQLEALLVHDPDTDKASAAVSVDVGNFSDDESLPGISHCIEHMLFMGTEKVSSVEQLVPGRVQREIMRGLPRIEASYDK